jgi:hypothetical protein
MCQPTCNAGIKISGAQVMEQSRAIDYRKKIPKKYREVILKALSHYPELQKVRIRFRLAKRHPVPYGTRPGKLSFFKAPENRTYVITLLEKARKPTKKALFKNLPPEAQLGALGHELAHVVQFKDLSRSQLARTCLLFTSMYQRRQIERDADIKTIEHGLGSELHAHAVYIRSIKGYVEQRKGIDIYYLKPHEILDGLSQVKTGLSAV